jgi:uncharacterized protein YceK
MKNINLLIFIVLMFALNGCGGGSSSISSTSSTSSSSSSNATTNSNCTQAPALGQATFGSGCFK